MNNSIKGSESLKHMTITLTYALRISNDEVLKGKRKKRKKRVLLHRN